jgi:hypothetical protein
MKSVSIMARAACALLLAGGSGYAAANTTVPEAPVSMQWIRQQMSECHKLPTSYRGICKADVSRRVDEAYVALPAGAVAVAPALAEPTRTAANDEMSRYGKLSAACKQAPTSERGSCADEASLGFARPERLDTGRG